MGWDGFCMRRRRGREKKENGVYAGGIRDRGEKEDRVLSAYEATLVTAPHFSSFWVPMTRKIVGVY
jgi:hypothetical protein